MNVGVKYHIYAVEWNADEYVFYYDNRPLHIVPSTDVPISKALQYVILSCEVRDNCWTGHIPKNGYGDKEHTSSYMEVDYVRVYSKNPYK